MTKLKQIIEGEREGFLEESRPYWELPELNGRIEDKIEMDRREKIALHEKEQLLRRLTHHDTTILKALREEIEGMKEFMVVVHGRDCKTGKRPCGAVEKPTYLADRCSVETYDERTLSKVQELINQALQDKE